MPIPRDQHKSYLQDSEAGTWTLVFPFTPGPQPYLNLVAIGAAHETDAILQFECHTTHAKWSVTIPVNALEALGRLLDRAEADALRRWEKGRE